MSFNELTNGRIPWNCGKKRARLVCVKLVCRQLTFTEMLLTYTILKHEFEFINLEVNGMGE